MNHSEALVARLRLVEATCLDAAELSPKMLEAWLKGIAEAVRNAAAEAMREGQRVND